MYEMLKEVDRICRKNETERVKLVSVFDINENETLAVLDLMGNVYGEKEIVENIYYYARQVFRSMNRETEGRFYLYYCRRKGSLRQFGKLYHENKNQLSQRYLKKDAQLLEFS